MKNNKIKVTEPHFAKQFFSIGDVSKIVGVEQHVLRFWESKFSQINPIRKAGNRRYYRKVDIEIILKIKEYVYDKGISIKGLQKFLKCKNKNALVADENNNLFENGNLTKDKSSIGDESLIVKEDVIDSVIKELSELSAYIKNITTDKDISKSK